MKSSGKIELQKTIFQVRYKPNLEFYELLIPTSRKLTTYPHWQTNKLKVTLFDNEKHCNLNINHDSFTYEQDTGDISLEKKHIDNAIKILPSSLKISSYSFFGYRRQYLIPVKMSFESLVHVLNIKLFSQDSRLKKIMPKNIEDLTYRIDSIEGEYKYHFTIGPIKKNEIPRYIPYNQELHFKSTNLKNEYLEIINNYPDIAIFLDVDFYQKSGNKSTLKDMNSFIEIAREKIEKFVSNLNNYLFSSEIKEG